MTRYALYFAPEEGSRLDQFGRWWLGRQPESPDYGPLPAVGLDPAWQERILAEARLYGFHATLKPPFRLAAGRSPGELADRLAAFAAGRRAFAAPPLTLQELNGFLALRPSSAAPEIDRLAEDCVRTFDDLRAPPAPAETARRLSAPLSSRQRDLLAIWGYPYVLDQYRFHVTLTGRLEGSERVALRSILEPLIGDIARMPTEVRSVCLFAQEGGRPFSLVRRFPMQTF